MTTLLEQQLNCPVALDHFEVRAVLSPIADDRGYLKILSLVDDLGGYPGAGFYRLDSTDDPEEDGLWIYDDVVQDCPPSRGAVVSEFVKSLPRHALNRFARFCSGIASTHAIEARAAAFAARAAAFAAFAADAAAFAANAACAADAATCAAARAARAAAFAAFAADTAFAVDAADAAARAVDAADAAAFAAARAARAAARAARAARKATWDEIFTELARLRAKYLPEDG